MNFELDTVKEKCRVLQPPLLLVLPPRIKYLSKHLLYDDLVDILTRDHLAKMFATLSLSYWSKVIIFGALQCSQYQ